MWTPLPLSLIHICYTFFGQQYDLPVFAGPVGATKLHYGEKYDDQAYNRAKFYNRRTANLLLASWKVLLFCMKPPENAVFLKWLNGAPFSAPPGV